MTIWELRRDTSAAILEILAGPMDACARDLARGDAAAAQTRLKEATEMLVRLRRDLREQPSQEGEGMLWKSIPPGEGSG